MKQIFLAFLVVVLTSTICHSATKVTALGITQEEINIWNQRRVSGPYRVAGDAQSNSPGDWARIDANASAFRSAGNTSERWSGQPAGSCWSTNSNPPALPGRAQGEKLRDAAFRFLLTGDTTDRDAALAGLLDQAAQAGTNYSDSTRWNTTSNCLSGDAWSWQLSMWMRKLLFAYDYIRHAIPAGNKTTLDAWFGGYANLMESNLDSTAITRFPNRNSDDYSVQNYTTCIQAYLTHFGGFTHCDFHEGWANRAYNHEAFMAAYGIMTANANYKTKAKRWWREWIRFNVFADNTAGEFHRSISDNSSSAGWSYTGLAIGTAITIADLFARSGDQELYNYSTSLGDNAGLTPAGGPKSLLSVVKKFLDYEDHTLLRYGTTISSNVGNSNYLMDGDNELVPGVHEISDINAVPVGNVFWNDARVKSMYLRQASGAPAYPANPSSFGACVYCGEWGVYPGNLFMFGQMEGKVNPYGATTSTPTSSSGVSVDSTYPGYTTAPIDDGVINAVGGTAATWASADDATVDHWININLPSSQQINTATIYWAYNSDQQKYMTSQRVDVQYWNGSSYVTTATMTYPGSNIPSTTVSFPVITTSRVRFYQPAGQGNPTYTGVFWITEVDYPYTSTPAAPTSLQAVSINP